MLGIGGGKLIGIDIGHYYTKVVGFSNRKGILELEYAFKEVTPQDVILSDGVDEVVLGDFLKSILFQRGVKARRASISLNSSFVITKTLVMPLVASEEIEQAIMWEAEQYAPVKMEEVNVSYQILSKNEEKNEMTVLIALTKKEIVESYIRAFKRAKLKIDTVDVDVFAMYNAYEANNEDAADKHLIFVDVGYSSTKLLFVRKGIPSFSRYMDFGFSSIIKEASDVLSLKDDEIVSILSDKNNDRREMLVSFINDKLIGLYTQIQNSITFYMSSILTIEEPIDEIILSGAIGSLYEDLNIEMVRELLKSDISRFNPFNVSSKGESGEFIDETVPEIASFYCSAVGLALRGFNK